MKSWQKNYLLGYCFIVYVFLSKFYILILSIFFSFEANKKNKQLINDMYMNVNKIIFKI